MVSIMLQQSTPENSFGPFDEKLRRALLPAESTILQTLQVIDKSGLQVALVCDPGGLLRGIITDGDIRRALIQGATLDAPVRPFLREDFVRVTSSQGRVEALDLMQSLRIKQVPIVDEAGVLSGLHLLDDMLSPVRLPNEAVILAGGKGMRLRPITEHLPKPMLKVAGRPILERLVLHLAGNGIRRIHLATNYMAHVVEDHFQNGERFGCEISYLNETQPLGTAGPLGLLPTTPQHPLIVVNGDLVTQFDVQSMLAAHQNDGNLLTIGVKIYSHQIPFGCVTLKGKQVVALAEKPSLSQLVNGGIYVLSPVALTRLAPGRPCQMTDLITQLIEEDERVGIFELIDDWIDVGQRSSLDQAREGS